MHKDESTRSNQTQLQDEPPKGWHMRFVLICLVAITGFIALSLFIWFSNNSNVNSSQATTQITQNHNPVVKMQEDGKKEIIFVKNAPPPILKSEPAPSSPIQLREYKPEGTQYNCSLTTQISGIGRNDNWGFRGSATFVITQELVWREHILENDGETLKVERFFTQSDASELVFEGKEFGLTEAASNGLILASQIVRLATPLLAASAEPTTLTALYATQKVLLTAGALGRSDKLPEILKNAPVAGDVFQQWLNKQASSSTEAGAIQLALKTIIGLKGERIILTWKNGQLTDARYTSGKEVPERVKLLASKVSPYVDQNIFPPETKMEGEDWLISAKDVADFYGADSGLRSATTGVLVILRNSDEIKDKVASLTAKGRTSYDNRSEDRTTKGDFIIESLQAKFPYEGKRRFIGEIVSKAIITYGVDKDPDSLLFDVKSEGDVVVNVEYKCTPIR